VRRGLAAAAIGLALSVIALVPVTTAGAAGDPPVTISAACTGSAFCFSPSTLTISDGDTVTWTNASGSEHFVGRCDPSSCDGVSGGTGTDTTFTSADVPDGASYAHTFHGAGTYTYFCAIHGYAAMHGVIVVRAASPPSTATTVAPPTTSQSVTTASLPGASLPGASTGGSVGGGSSPISAAASVPATTFDPRLAHTGHDIGGTLAVGVGALVLGLAAWGACTPRRGAVPRLRR
jgi:plastocyanin